jgi:hypothetical protein
MHGSLSLYWGYHTGVQREVRHEETSRRDPSGSPDSCTFAYGCTYFRPDSIAGFRGRAATAIAAA